MKKDILKKVFNYMKKYIPHLILALCLSAITVALSLYFPILVGKAIDLIVDKGNVNFDDNPNIKYTNKICV